MKAFNLRKQPFLCIIIMMLFVYSASAYSATKYIWSVVPQFTGTAVHRDWTPLIEYIQNKTGYHFKLKIYDSIPKFEDGFLRGEPDIAYMNPYHAVMAKETQGYTPLLRSSTRLLSGIIVVRKDSTIKTVKQLNGKKITFPSPNAFAASLYMRALLKEKEQIDFSINYAGTHSNAYRKVLIGHSTAAGAVKRTLQKERSEVQQNLRIIYKTPKFPSHPLTAHKRVPQKVKNAVQNAILSLVKTEQGRKLLNPVLLSDPIKANYKKDYQPLKLLKLEKYLVR